MSLSSSFLTLMYCMYFLQQFFFSAVLHHIHHFASNFYADWAGFKESSRLGEKYEVVDRSGINAMMSRAQEIREERKKKHEQSIEIMKDPL